MPRHPSIPITGIGRSSRASRPATVAHITFAMVDLVLLGIAVVCMATARYW